MAHTRGRLGCTKCSEMHRTIREEQKCQDIQIKKRTWWYDGKYLVSTHEEETVRAERKTLWSLHWKEYWHTGVLFLSWLCTPKARFESPIQEDATLDKVLSSTSLLCTNHTESHILPSNRWSTYIHCHCLKICFRESSQSDWAILYLSTAGITSIFFQNIWQRIQVTWAWSYLADPC